MSETVKVYADALFQLSVEENLLEVVQQDLKSCADILKGEPEFLTILSSPIISNGEKISMLQAVFDGNCNELVYNFMCLLVEKGRFNLILEVQSNFSQQYNESKNLLEAEVITSIPLTEELRQKVIAKLTKLTGKHVTIVETVDKSILGGIVIKYGNTVIDDSVKARFKELSKQLHTN
jgi:F-type H+-transporting ATPase subunit delta